MIICRCKLPDEFSNSSYNLNKTELEKWYPYNNFNNKFSSCEIIINNQTVHCNEFIYDPKTYGYTAVIEWTLTCENAYLIAISNSIFMFGVMVGSIGFGELSDRWGRKKTFFLSLVTQVVFGIIAAFAPEIWTFSIARAVVGATTSGVFLVAYVIGLEMVGPSKRTIAGTVIIPESARWLISKNKIQEAKRLIQIAAKSNKVVITDETLDKLLVCKEEKVEKNEKKPSTLDIFKYPNLRKRTLIILFDWFANNITYYGLSWNTNNLAGNPYLNFVISGAVELPAYTFLILTLNRWGRKKIMCGCMIVAGIALLLTMVVPKGLELLNILIPCGSCYKDTVFRN
ncbi:hypothetical protein GWI33_019553 [Rhynchophorus ferrugineus]|uniref:Uncharacterized protein n=1 Tax=Rhynchophorus ferrugineus TaxID=354439 RepID=A0A834M6Y0_RHYFE|nr:hypothetical protein GWI33_019553 [Rhynchophorus ferrugineus]